MKMGLNTHANKKEKHSDNLNKLFGCMLDLGKPCVKCHKNDAKAF